MRLDAEAIARLNTMAEAARGFEAPAWDEAGITDGASVLDVGCGTGAVLAEFAARVGAAGHAVGIDESPDAIETCRAYLADRGQGQATAMIADAFENELKSGTFDAAHLRLVLIHHGPRIQELLAAVSDLVRPGGHVVLTDVDAPSCGLSEHIPELEELIAAWMRMMSRRGNDVRMGVHLPSVAADAGLDIVSFRGAVSVIPPTARFRLPHWDARDALVTDGVASETDVRRWEPVVSDFITARTCYFALPMYTVVARRGA
jgi:SAM-dependent methyltransferase